MKIMMSHFPHTKQQTLPPHFWHLPQVPMKKNRFYRLVADLILEFITRQLSHHAPRYAMSKFLLNLTFWNFQNFNDIWKNVIECICYLRFIEMQIFN